MVEVTEHEAAARADPYTTGPAPWARTITEICALWIR